MIKELILSYEKDFLNSSFCKNIDNLNDRISIGFVEYGKSGLIYDRDEVVAALLNFEDRFIDIHGFDLQYLSEDVLLIHYISVHKNGTTHKALRTSIWKKEDNKWKIYFHQGTPILDKTLQATSV